jgi:hypothetical protein
VLNFGIPAGVKGDKGNDGDAGETGPAGPANSLSIGTVSGGETAEASITGTAPSQTLNLVLPKGEKGDTGSQGLKGDTGDTGPANSLSIGTVENGDTASASITGDAPSQVLNLTLPKGEKGDPGDVGPAGSDGIGVPSGGSTGQALVKASDDDFDTKWGTGGVDWSPIATTTVAGSPTEIVFDDLDCEEWRAIVKGIAPATSDTLWWAFSTDNGDNWTAVGILHSGGASTAARYGYIELSGLKLGNVIMRGGSFGTSALPLVISNGGNETVISAGAHINAIRIYTNGGAAFANTGSIDEQQR